MIEDIIKSIRATLYDRTSSPLFGSLAISWVLWNFRLFLVIFSEMTVQQKFDYVDTVLYADPIWRWLPLVAGPVLTTLIILFVYPWPAQWVYAFWHHRQRELKRIRQQIEDETPLTIEQSKAIRRRVIDIQAEYEAQLSRRDEDNSRLKQMLTEEQSTRTELAKTLAEREQQLAAKDRLLADSQDRVKLQGFLEEARPNEEEIRKALNSRPYRLIFNPHRDRAKGSKLMLFGPDGKIIEGGNRNENSWRVKDGLLELINSAGEVHNRFRPDFNTGIFTTTGDSNIKALAGQYMTPEQSAAATR